MIAISHQTAIMRRHLVFISLSLVIFAQQVLMTEGDEVNKVLDRLMRSGERGGISQELNGERTLREDDNHVDNKERSQNLETSHHPTSLPKEETHKSDGSIPSHLVLRPTHLQTEKSPELPDNAEMPRQHQNEQAAVDTFVYYPTCTYAGVTYPAGTIFSPEPCVECHCNATTGFVSCSVPPCPDLGANCLRFEYEHHREDTVVQTPSPAPPSSSPSSINKHAECCPRCAQRGCVFNGLNYLPGAKIEVSPCEMCYCPWKGGDPVTGAPFCLKQPCPELRCVDARTEKGSCCPVCPNGPNCWLDDKVIKEGERVFLDRCRYCYCSDLEYIYNPSRRHATCVRSFFCL